MITAQEAREKSNQVERERLMAIIDDRITKASARGQYFVIIEEVYWPLYGFLSKELKEKGFTLEPYKKTSQYETCGGIEVLKISWAR